MPFEHGKIHVSTTFRLTIRRIEDDFKSEFSLYDTRGLRVLKFVYNMMNTESIN